jgi:hypothetical protein
MQIDFHHGVTYVIARLAGFELPEADIIAHSAQYVDDATESGEIWFANGMLYPRISSAHKMLDYRNSRKLANHRVWLPFHFLPGNRGEPVPDAPPPFTTEDDFILRCVCRPNSYPARELMRTVITRQDREYALYRLGIAAHVFVDTWAHQGFVGYQHQINIATNIIANDEHHEQRFEERAAAFVKWGWGSFLSWFLGEAFPLGHGTVLSYPDRPYLTWSYTNGLGERVERDNPSDFLEAAKNLYMHFRRYIDYKEDGEGAFGKLYDFPAEFETLGDRFKTVKDEDGEARHRAWLEMAANGTFGFKDQISYIQKGEGSWKHQALGTLKDVGHNPRRPLAYPPQFLSSHWKHFHDALQAHRFYVLSELLPRYGILSG